MHSPGAIVIQGEGWALQPPTSDHPGVQLWTARRLPFSDQQDAEQRAMVRQCFPVARSTATGWTRATKPV